jgi:uncharacterized protein (TIGR00369 family)
MDTGLTKFMSETMPFMGVLGAEAISASPDEVNTQLAWDPSRCTSGGVLHGGTLMTLADGTAGWCAFLNLPAGAATTTIESKTNFLRAVRSGVVQATSRPLHVGRTVIVIDTEVRDDAGRLVARTTQTQAVVAGAAGARPAG